MRGSSGPIGHPNVIRLAALTGREYRKKHGMEEPARPQVQWWTPYVGTWLGTAVSERSGATAARLELIDPTDPAFNGVPSVVFTEMISPDGKTRSDFARIAEVTLSSAKGEFVFPWTEAIEITNSRADVTATSKDGKRLVGTIAVPNAKNLRWSFAMTR